MSFLGFASGSCVAAAKDCSDWESSSFVSSASAFSKSKSKLTVLMKRNNNEKNICCKVFVFISRFTAVALNHVEEDYRDSQAILDIPK